MPGSSHTYIQQNEQYITTHITYKDIIKRIRKLFIILMTKCLIQRKRRIHIRSLSEAAQPHHPIPTRGKQPQCIPCSFWGYSTAAQFLPTRGSSHRATRSTRTSMRSSPSRRPCGSLLSFRRELSFMYYASAYSVSDILSLL